MAKISALPNTITNPEPADLVAVVDDGDDETKKMTLGTLLNMIYPIGSIYTNATDNTNPGSLLGFGTWVAFAQGRVPVGINGSDADFDTAEETGGAKTNTHNHFTGHSFDGGGIYSTNTPYLPRSRVVGKDHSAPIGAGNTGGNTREDSTYDETISTMPPYVVVYMWKRTA